MAKKTFGMSAGSPIKARMNRRTYRDLSPAGPPPADPEAAFEEAVRFHREGRPLDAESRVRHILSAEPENVDASYLLGIIALQTDRAEEAARWISKAIEGKGDVAEFHVNLGVALLSSGKADEGIQTFRTALDIQSGNGDAHLNLGLAFLQKNEFDQAASHLREAVRLMPKHAGARMNLGMALSRLDGTEAGIPHLQKAVKLAPKDALARANLGNALRDAGDLEAALAEYDSALAIHPGAAPLHFSRAQLLGRMGHERQAVAAYERAIELDGYLAPAFNNLALVLSRRGRHEEAVEHARKAVSLWPKQPDFRLNYGNVLTEAGRIHEALTCYESLEQEFPEFSNGFLQHIKVLQQVGDFERARGVIDIFRQINPDPSLVFSRLVTDRSLQINSEELDAVQAAIEKADRPERAIGRLCFSMGQALENQKRFDESFAYYRKGNEIWGAANDYDPIEASDRTDRLISAFDRAFFNKHREDGVADDRPVFIVGMLRSGTSLIEQILASHRWVGAAGDLTDFHLLSRELPEILGGGEGFPECVRKLDPKNTKVLAEVYLRKMARQFPNARRFVDKMPTNFLHLGLIALLFPRAQIIHCRRDPMDTCFSMFALSFSGRHPYAYNMEHLAHFYAEYERLMEHWQKVCPVPILEIRYEDVIADTEAKTREILDFCRLDWDDDCLRFYETGRTVPTASSWQVRQPVYRSSVSRWQRYEEHLRPLRAALEGNGVRLED